MQSSEILAVCNLFDDKNTVVLYKIVTDIVVYDVCQSNGKVRHFTDLLDAINNFNEIIHNGLI